MAAFDLSRNAHRFDSRDGLGDALAATVAERLEDAIGARGRASLVVSGGSTPVPFFEALRRRPLEWSRVSVTVADERWVPEDDEQSNAWLVRRHLLQQAAAAATYVSLKNDAPDPFSGAAAAGAAVASMPHPFDAVVLGMGGDGHTASLFPLSEQLDAALDLDNDALCCGVHGEKPPRERITLTLRALLDSRWIAVHITGDDKWDTLTEAAAEGAPRQFPIRSILHQNGVPVDVYWAA
ncbi:MAG TPA: 6-phosphogluconolactonase [Gammaproteobacteria bacterium]|nr:6-phosphogluconolactonase [Gammaproteobacteria bacterium]